MAENIGHRVGRILSGGFHSLVNAVENIAPEAVMEQAIREIDNAIEEVRSELGQIVANKHLATRRLQEENHKHEKLTANLELAVAQARDDLAEAAIEQQFDIEAQIPVLEQTIRDAGERMTELEGYVLALQAKKREMKEELQAFRHSRAASTGSGVANGTAGSTNASSIEQRVNQAESAFERVLEQQTGLATGAASSNTSANRIKIAELEELARRNRVQERLANFKAREH